MTNEIQQDLCEACDRVLSFPHGHLAPRFCFSCLEDMDEHLETPEVTDAELEDWACQWDDDPNPYHGDYSEM